VSLDEIEKALTGQDLTGTEVAVAVTLLAVGIASYFLVGLILRRSTARLSQVIPGELLDVGIRVVQFLVLWVFIAWSLSVLGMSTGWLTFLIVAVLLIGAFVAKPFLDGLVSSVVVATRTAVAVGDEIEIDGVVGEIEGIAKRSTIVATRDGRKVYIPNSELIDKTVTVFTALDERRSAIDFTVGLDTDLETVDRVVHQSLASVEPVRRVGSIRARSFSEGVDISVRIWHGPRIVDGNDAVDAAVRSLKLAFERDGIRFAPASSLKIEQDHLP
jgi:small-conductance mechanosensitive channel